MDSLSLRGTRGLISRGIMNVDICAPVGCITKVPLGDCGGGRGYEWMVVCETEGALVGVEIGRMTQAQRQQAERICGTEAPAYLLFCPREAGKRFHVFTWFGSFWGDRWRLVSSEAVKSYTFVSTEHWYN